MEMKEIDFTKAYVDMDEICHFLTKDDKLESITSEIMDTYDFTADTADANGLATKVVHEARSKGNNQRDNIRYDLVKTFLSVFLGVDNASDFGLGMATQTLMKYNMIKFDFNNE